jgi:hypothetical protein
MLSEEAWSILIPLNGLCYFGIRINNVESWLSIEKGQFLLFRGDLCHCGGPNMMEEIQYRIHGYLETEGCEHPENAIIVDKSKNQFIIKPIPIDLSIVAEPQILPPRACKREKKYTPDDLLTI